MKTVVTFFAVFLCAVSSAYNKIDLTKEPWQTNCGNEVFVPHSFTFLTQSGVVTNSINARSLRYERTLPKIMPGKQYVLQIDGLSRYGKIYIGRGEIDYSNPIGLHTYGFLPSRYDLTEYLDFSDGATNKIAIVVDCDGNTYPHKGRIVPFSGDFCVFHGLYRKVWLYELDDFEHLSEYPESYVKPALSFRNGFFYDASGKRVFLKGVNLHQYRGYDWTYDESREKNDLLMIKAMGANAIRTAHYPKSPRFYEMCDELGLYVFTEVPLVNIINPDNEVEVSMYLNYVESLVREYSRYKCIISWGLYNELSEDCWDLMEKANKLVHSLDPNRPTYGANMETSHNQSAHLADLITFNCYWNWYSPSYMHKSWIEYVCNIRKQWLKDGPFYVTEYGGKSNINHHSYDKIDEEQMSNMTPVVEVENGITNTYLRPNNPTKNQFFPDDYMLWLHRSIWNEIMAAYQKPESERSLYERYFVSHCGGVFIWQFCDTPAPHRHEGGADCINFGGVVDINRTPKAAYEFYKGIWNNFP